MDNNYNITTAEGTEEVRDLETLPLGDRHSSLMSKIKNRLIGVEDIDVNKDLHTANDSYLLSKYGHTHARNERLSDFLKEIGTKIKEMNDRGSYACVTKVPEDLFVFISAIISLFKQKGYAVTNLKDCVDNIACDYIFLCWDKFDGQREKSESNS